MQAQFATPEEIPYAVAYGAHRGTSFSPERRAESEQAEYARFLNAVAVAIRTLGEELGQSELAEAELARFKEGYKKRYLAELHSKSRIVSSMISGPANFPVARMQKRNATAHKRLDELLEYGKRGQDAMKRNIRRAAEPAKVFEGEAREVVLGTPEGVEIVINREAERVQILLDEKPDDVLRAKLKGAGWNWSPRNKAWQRMITANTLQSAKRIFNY